MKVNRIEEMANATRRRHLRAIATMQKIELPVASIWKLL
jgi:hypothetical protein